MNKTTKRRKNDSDHVKAFAQLADAANGRWDGVDVNKYVEGLRSSGIQIIKQLQV